MGIYRRVFCSACRQGFELQDSAEKAVACRFCSAVVKLSEQNTTYYIDYYYQNRRKRERVGPYRKVAERALAKRLTQVAENRFLV